MRVALVNHNTRWDSHVANMNLEAHAKALLDDIEHLNQVCSHGI